MKKKLLALLLAMTMVMALVACGGNGNQKGNNNQNTEPPKQEDNTQTPEPAPAPTGASEITLWTYPIGKWGDEATVKALTDAFTAETGIAVKVDYLAYADGDDKVNTALTAGGAPDLIMEGPERLVANWGANGHMVDLKDMLDDTDKSEDYLTILEEKYPHLYHSFVPESSRYISRKKLAVMLGIKASKYDWMVFTNADCMPQSNQWLRLMARNFTPRTQVVLGYSGYERGKGWLHKRAAFDNLFTSMRYLGFALAGSPYMGIGRNLAYRKELFYQQKGFSAHLNLQRGDDDLFINHVATPENTRVETDAKAIVRMPPLLRAKDWKEEKIGYASTARLYHGMQRRLAGFETLSRLAFHATWTAAMIIGILHFHWLAAGVAFLLFLLRFTMQAVIVNKTACDLEEQRSYYFTLPVFDLLQPIQSLRWKWYCLFRKKSGFLRK